MKKNRSRIAVLMLSLLLMPLMADGQQTGTLRWEYKNMNVSRSQDGSQMIISLDIEPKEKSLTSQEVVILSSSFVSTSGDQYVDLGSFVVSGAMRMKMLKRSAALGNDLPDGITIDQVNSLKDVIDNPIHVEKSVPFEHWMTSGQIYIRERAMGCANCESYSVEGVKYRAEIQLFNPEDYRFYDYEPNKVTEKSYEEEFISHIGFKVGRSDLLREFEDNARELNRMDDFVRKALRLSDTGATIDSVYITGFASPEGDYNSNLRLSQARSETISKVVWQRYPGLSKTAQLVVKGAGEDWTGLKNALIEMNLSYSSQVATIIDRYNTDHEREKEIMALEEGRVYSDILNNIYPTLRRTVFRMKYKVRPYTTEELPRIYEQKPALLSNWELYELAQKHYVAEGLNPTEVYATAYQLYPKEREAVLNYATALLQYNKDAKMALQVLESLAADGQVVFLRAIAKNMQGELAEAEELLRASADFGNEDAKLALGW